MPLGRLLSAGRARTGRPAKDRAALATAFLAKAIFNLPTTRHLMDRLRVDQNMLGCRGTLQTHGSSGRQKQQDADDIFAALNAFLTSATFSGARLSHWSRRDGI
jgi:transposase-like protein DUF772